MKELMLSMGIIPIILVLTTQTAMAQFNPANGYNDGVNQARADWTSGAHMDASCQAHGIQNAGNEQYCGNYKSGYLFEQGVLIITK